MTGTGVKGIRSGDADGGLPSRLWYMKGIPCSMHTDQISTSTVLTAAEGAGTLCGLQETYEACVWLPTVHFVRSDTVASKRENNVRLS